MVPIRWFPKSIPREKNFIDRFVANSACLVAVAASSSTVFPIPRHYPEMESPQKVLPFRGLDGAETRI